MPTIAHDTNKIPRLLLVDANGKLILGDAAALIGHVKISDGTEQATVNAQNILDVSPEHGLKGKTILYHNRSQTNGTGTIHTVTAGKTYYLLAAGLTYYATATNKNTNIHVANAATVLIRMQSHYTATYQTTTSETAIISFPHPIPITAGTEIRVFAEDTDITGNAWIIGWEE